MSVLIWPIFLYPFIVGAIGVWHFFRLWKKREINEGNEGRGLFISWSIWTILIGVWIILIYPTQRFGPPYVSPDPLVLWFLYTYWIFVPTVVLFILVAIDTLRRF
ncbi:MAG: hypothetical protein EAX95_12660 [Candidatus Thorarchaeota archaeon]|nr:hypothetical protein [Candidatus Thorarchaeota archaeon]